MFDELRIGNSRLLCRSVSWSDLGLTDLMLMYVIGADYYRYDDAVQVAVPTLELYRRFNVMTLYCDFIKK